MNMSYITLAIQIAAALYIVGLGVIALNNMNRRTRHVVRLAYIFLVGGGISAIAAGMTRRDIFECMLVVGVALYLFCNKRGMQNVS